MWKAAAFALVKAILFLVLATLALFAPLAESVEGIASYSHLAPGRQLYGEIAMAFAQAFLPSLLVDAALAGLFPAWRILRYALPGLSALALVGWAGWMWVFFGPAGKFPGYSIADMRWSLIAAGPAGIVVAGTFMFLLARSRPPTALLG